MRRLCQLCRDLWSDRSGSTLVLVTVILPALLMIAVVIVDLGLIHLARSQLQTGLDAAALAAVRDGTVGRVQIQHEDVTLHHLLVTPDEMQQIPARDLVPFPDGTVRRPKERWDSCARYPILTDPETGEAVVDPATGHPKRQCEGDWVLDGYYVNRIVRDRAVKRILPGIDMGAARQQAGQVIQANLDAWAGSGRGLYRNIRIEQAELICTDPATEAQVAGFGECPNLAAAGKLQVRYRVLSGSMEVRTLLAGPVIGLFQAGQPAPWIRVRLHNQEATLQFQRQ